VKSTAQEEVELLEEVVENTDSKWENGLARRVQEASGAVPND
jgi:hypothetical protein